MIDQELLTVAESVLRDAIDTAEFTELPKDLEYVKFVAQRVENLRAKIKNRPAVTIKDIAVGPNHHLVVEYAFDAVGFLKGK